MLLLFTLLALGGASFRQWSRVELIRLRWRQAAVRLTNNGSKAVRSWTPPPRSAISSGRSACPEPACQEVEKTQPEDPPALAGSSFLISKTLTVIPEPSSDS